ncbi:MAG: hypothetical protein QOF02_2239 [Blastocatellia bacterium]|jgi:hypothetical protein|nr:hypothetical protein [Blastocatellia bacterium]
MFNLDTLDTVIAIVVVLLVLSLIVQAIQSFIKKVLRLKSKEIEKSLGDLFEHIVDKGAATPPAQVPASDSTKGTLAATDKDASSDLVQTVLGEFKKVGRYTQRGRLMLDSISKEDLLKILARVDSTHFYSDYVTKFQAMYADIKDLETEINRLVANNPPLLQGAASAKFAEMQAGLSPLINDVKNIVSGNSVKQNVLFGDLINLRRVKLDDALQLLASAQDSIAADLKAAQANKNTATVAALEQLSASLTTIAGILGQLSQRMDAAFATLRTKLDHVEVWYDTVMQSFEERYARQMKTIAIYISIGVVVYLNASFFRIYHNIATNDLQRALIVSEGSNLSQNLQGNTATNNANRGAGVNTTGGAANSNSGASVNTNARPNVRVNPNAVANINANANANSVSATPNNTDSGNTNNGSTNNGGSLPAAPAPAADNAATATPSPSPDEPAVTTEEVNKQRQVIEDYVETYEGFGFSPLTWAQVKTWFSRLVFSAPRLSEDGKPLNNENRLIPENCQSAKQDCAEAHDAMTGAEWVADRRRDFSTLLGWAIMVLLLSVGAPFWQDALESLFGVKNLLRKKTDTKNVETESGAGQPKQ